MTRSLTQRLVLVCDSRLVEGGFHVEHGLLGRLEDGVQPSQNGHRQDHVEVLAAHVQVAKDIVRDAPDEVGNPTSVAHRELPNHHARERPFTIFLFACVSDRVSSGL
jgi:hypothetical protein